MFPALHGLLTQALEAFLPLGYTSRVLHFATSICARELSLVTSACLSPYFVKMELLLA
jgi:hypothetical protein